VGELNRGEDSKKRYFRQAFVLRDDKSGGFPAREMRDPAQIATSTWTGRDRNGHPTLQCEYRSARRMSYFVERRCEPGVRKRRWQM